MNYSPVLVEIYIFGLKDSQISLTLPSNIADEIIDRKRLIIPQDSPSEKRPG
jgi:hypothetical protein